MGELSKLPNIGAVVEEQLNSRMKVPVVFYFAMREPGRTYRFHFIRTEPVKIGRANV